MYDGCQARDVNRVGRFKRWFIREIEPPPQCNLARKGGTGFVDRCGRIGHRCTKIELHLIGGCANRGTGRTRECSTNRRVGQTSAVHAERFWRNLKSLSAHRGVVRVVHTANLSVAQQRHKCRTSNREELTHDGRLDSRVCKPGIERVHLKWTRETENAVIGAFARKTKLEAVGSYIRSIDLKASSDVIRANTRAIHGHLEPNRNEISPGYGAICIDRAGNRAIEDAARTEPCESSPRLDRVIGEISAVCPIDGKVVKRQHNFACGAGEIGESACRDRTAAASSGALFESHALGLNFNVRLAGFEHESFRPRKPFLG